MKRGPGAGRLIPAFLLPPLAIFMADGISRDFWISFVLTCVGWVPGIVYTLFVLLSRPTNTSRPA